MPRKKVEKTEKPKTVKQPAKIEMAVPIKKELEKVLTTAPEVTGISEDEVLRKGSETSGIANNTEEQGIPLGESEEQRILAAQQKEDEPETKQEDKKETRGRPKGSYKKKTDATGQLQGNPQDVISSGINNMLIAPVGAFLLDDYSKAQITGKQNEFLNYLLPVEEIKPSWTGYCIALGVTTISNFVNAYLSEKMNKKKTDITKPTDEMVIELATNMSEEQRANFVKMLLNNTKQKEEAARNAEIINRNKEEHNDKQPGT